MDGITDERTAKEKLNTWGFIVANCDWGDSRLYVVRPVKEREEAQFVMDFIKEERRDLKRVRYVSGTLTKDGLIYKPKLRNSDRVHIYNFTTFLPAGDAVLVGGRVSYPAAIRGKITQVTELANGITDVVTAEGRGLLLEEWRVIEMLPEQRPDIMRDALSLGLERDKAWRAWAVGDNIRTVMQRLGLPYSENPRHDMLEMMRDYKRKPLAYFIGEGETVEEDDLLDVEVIADLQRNVQSVRLSLTS